MPRPEPRRARRLAAAVAVTTLAATLAAAGPGTTAPTVPEPRVGARAVEDARFQWALSRETGNRGFAPGTVNLLSAGRRADPGSSRVMTRQEWHARRGTVTIQKRTAGGGYRTATWAGLSTTPAGEPLGAPTAGTTSGNRVSVAGGRGTADPRRDDATLRWDGSFTVAYYSGYTSFDVSDPVLRVRDGRGTVRATLDGFGTSMDDMDEWTALPSRTVTIATLRRVDVTATGLTATPRYRRVTYAPPAGSGSPAQVRTGPHWGSWPRAFVDYQQRTGQHSYWYSSGGSTDAAKTALPVTVRF